MYILQELMAHNLYLIGLVHHSVVVLGLVEHLKDGFEHISILVAVHALINKVQTVVEGVTAVHISQHGFCQMESGQIGRASCRERV